MENRGGLKSRIFVVFGGQQGTLMLVPELEDVTVEFSQSERSGAAIGAADANESLTRLVAPYRPPRPRRIFLLSNLFREDKSALFWFLSLALHDTSFLEKGFFILNMKSCDVLGRHEVGMEELGRMTGFDGGELTTGKAIAVN